MEKSLKQQPATCLKFVFYGPESTGKTSLSKMLSAHYDCPYVPEYAREYLQQLWDREELICRYDDLLPIARGQISAENTTTRFAKMLMIDTDLLQTYVYAMAYLGKSPASLKNAAFSNTYTHYFLTYIDAPWEFDVLRDKPNEREAMFDKFKKALIQKQTSYSQLQGDLDSRLATAQNIIDRFIRCTK